MLISEFEPALSVFPTYVWIFYDKKAEQCPQQN